MLHDTEKQKLMYDIANKSMDILQSLKEHPKDTTHLFEQYMSFLNNYQLMIESLMQNPEKIMTMQAAYLEDASGLLFKQLNTWLTGQPQLIEDKRFKHESWSSHPFFNLMSQHYLLASEHINSLMEQIDFGDKRTAHRVQFFARQILEALSPDNFIPTNPQLMAETIKSNGKNLLRGMNNFLQDIDSGSARLVMKMTDSDAFTVGKNLAVTKGKVIFRNELMELIQYSPVTNKVKSIPLLIIPPWINKYYILDLSPNNSMISWLLNQGISVFVISWVNPGKKHAKCGIEDYMNLGPIKALELVQKQLNVDKVNTLGFCIGGTLLALTLAYLKAKKKNPVHSATFLASLIDFKNPGDISVYIDEQQIDKLEQKMQKKGYLEGQFMANAFNSLRASDLIWSFFIKHYLRGQSPVPFDILYWNSDATNMPATMHSEYLRWMYLHNDLIKPNQIKLNKTPIDVSQIDVPTFFVSTKKDHIAPWETTYTGFKKMGGPKRFLLGGSGHIAGIINPPENNKYSYYTNSAAPDTPEKMAGSGQAK